jgi:hypothetical protein
MQQAGWQAPGGGGVVEHDGATFHLQQQPAHSTAMDCEPTLQIG